MDVDALTRGVIWAVLIAIVVGWFVALFNIRFHLRRK